MLSRFNPPREPQQLGYAALAPVDGFLERHRTPILIAIALVSRGRAVTLLHWLQKTPNPMNLRSSKVESVATYLDLKSNPNSGANDIQLLAATPAEAEQAAAKLRALPEVARVTTLFASFIPDLAAGEKLKLIADAAKGARSGAQSTPA